MRIIYVDDEMPALQNFKYTLHGFDEVESLELFQNGNAALQYLKNSPVDIAFLDIEMQGKGYSGIELAKQIRKIDNRIVIIFITAYASYALDAFGVDAVDYLMKPYMKEDIKRTLKKAVKYAKLPAFEDEEKPKRVVVKTMPNFSVTIDGAPFHIGREKVLELFALLIENGERGITTGEGIACLWPDRPNDANAQSLFRVTYKRLIDVLDSAGIGDIVVSENHRRYVVVDKIECDLYKMLKGDKSVIDRYDGRYMQEYSWAEERNGQLLRSFYR